MELKVRARRLVYILCGCIVIEVHPLVVDQVLSFISHFP